jgi:hypothetical protein
MRRSDGESYLLIDHSDSPGLTGDQCARAGIPAHAHEIFAKGVKAEFGTKSCSHCQRQIVLRPERVRPRHFCPKCDKYICDNCHVNFALTFECVPFKKRIEDYLRKAALAQINAKL